MACQSLRSAARTSWVETPRSPEPGWARANSATRASKSLRLARCAALHRARALRKTVWQRRNQPGERLRWSRLSSGVSSTMAWVRICISERSGLWDLASWVSWYCLADRRYCQGIETFVHKAEKADGWHRVRGEDFPRVVLGEAFGELVDPLLRELGRDMFHPGVLLGLGGVCLEVSPPGFEGGWSVSSRHA